MASSTTGDSIFNGSVNVGTSIPNGTYKLNVLGTTYIDPVEADNAFKIYNGASGDTLFNIGTDIDKYMEIRMGEIVVVHKDGSVDTKYGATDASTRGALLESVVSSSVDGEDRKSTRLNSSH